MRSSAALHNWPKTLSRPPIPLTPIRRWLCRSVDPFACQRDPRNFWVVPSQAKEVRTNHWSSLRVEHCVEGGRSVGTFLPAFPAHATTYMSSDGGKKKSRGSAAVAPSSRINHVASSKSSEIAGTLPWTADDDRTILEAAEKELRKTGYVYTVHVLQHEYYIYIYVCVCVCVCVSVLVV